jgi:phage terminase Nu1 subunit (DNA packaging protein)
MAEEHVLQKELASRLSITPREVYNLVQKGMPRRVRNGKVDYPAARCVQWYIQYKVESTKKPVDDDKSKKKDLLERQLEAEVRLAELELAREEGRTVTVEYMEAQLEGILQRLRSKLLNIPGKYAPMLVGLRTMAEAQAKLEPIVAEAMSALAESGEDADLDHDDADDAGSEAGVAA